MNLYLDIETLPTSDAAMIKAISETVTVPGNYKKPETIAEWEREQKPALVKEAIAKTSFDGAFGHVCAIGWAFDDEEPTVELAHPDNEDTLLSVFISSVNKWIGPNYFIAPTIVGHNVVNFDIRFLWQRAIVLGVRMPQWFPRDPKPWSNEAFDTMTAFAGARNTIGMERLCLALGMEGKGEIDGSMIADLWARGELEKVRAYCAADVARTRAIHRRMMLAYGEIAA
jgi:hypothetical protein